MGNFTTVVDKLVGDTFTQPMWATYIEQNLNKGVNRPIADVILGSAAASFDLTTIDQNFAHLCLDMYLRGDNASGSIEALLRFNADSAANYDYVWQYASASVGGGAGGALAGTSAGLSGTAIPAATAPANSFAAVRIVIPHYTNAANHKVANALIATKTAVALANITVMNVGAFWRAITAISRITITPSAGNFAAGSRATLYGLAY